MQKGNLSCGVFSRPEVKWTAADAESRDYHPVTTRRFAARSPQCWYLS